MVQILEASKEFMEQQIASYESKIVKAINMEQEAIEKRITEGQHSRNRGIVREIITTCSTFKQEIKDEFNEMRDDEEQ